MLDEIYKKFVILIDNDSQSCIILVENDYQYRLEHSPHIFRSYWIGHFQLSPLYARKD